MCAIAGAFNPPREQRADNIYSINVDNGVKL